MNLEVEEHHARFLFEYTTVHIEFLAGFHMFALPMS